MKKNTIQILTPWIPTKPTSQGAIAYHEAVIDASWHIDNITKMIRLIKKTINTGDVVVDFGAGTGSSAIYLLKQIPCTFSLVLVDNSPSWLGHAYSLVHKNPQVTCLLLEKNEKGYKTLDDIIGENRAHQVIAANTVHLIPNIRDTFAGIYQALLPNGFFTLQSGNMKRKGRELGLMMIDDSVRRVHDHALFIIKTDKKYKQYAKDIDSREKETLLQRKFVFPDPRPLEYYIEELQACGFRNIKKSYTPIRVLYKDWLSFLRVRRLQAGILPEIGGKEPTKEQEHDRDEIIIQAAKLFFRELSEKNSFANKISFTAEWVYIQAQK